ncbi:UNVERIFIED_CONTAM: hypothetical protein NY100_18290, partial [Prevotella sp. 15_C9]
HCAAIGIMPQTQKNAVKMNLLFIGINFKIINKTAISWCGSNRMVADMYCLSYCPTLIEQ